MTLTEYFEKDPEVRSALDDAVNRGVRVTVAVHSYLTPEEIELGIQGKIDVRYLPQQPLNEFIINAEGMAVFSDDKTVTKVTNARFLPGILYDELRRGIGGRRTEKRRETYFVPIIYGVGSILASYDSEVEHRTIPNHVVPAGKIAGFAAMLRDKKAPEDIVAYLEAGISH